MFDLPSNTMHTGIPGDIDQSFYSIELFRFADVLRKMACLEEKIEQAVTNGNNDLTIRLIKNLIDTKVEINGLSGRYEFLEQICQGYLEAIDCELLRRGISDIY